MPDEVCSPKPWRLECTEFAVRVVDANGERVATVALGEDDPSHEDWDENVANAEHIVRCVNAFAKLAESLDGMVINVGEALALRFAGLAIPEKVWQAIVDVTDAAHQAIADANSTQSTP